MEKINYKVESKEKIYFAFKVIFGFTGYFLIYFLLNKALSSKQYLTILPLLIYALIIGLFLLLRIGLLIGYLKGNSIKVTGRQFRDIYEIALKQSDLLGIEKVPDIYILQNGGFLNAFATRFLGNNYVIIYSDILEEAYENNKDTVEFIIGHELGHIKRKHMTKSLIFFPSIIIPFLNRSYSRACEYTCDNIGSVLNPKGAQSGLLILASGKRLWKKVDVEGFIEQETTEKGFWSWFAEKTSTHPKLTKRLLRFKNLNLTITEPVKVEEIVSDHSAYLPKI
jgi:Zn-dependent protease with chaperone function